MTTKRKCSSGSKCFTPKGQKVEFYDYDDDDMCGQVPRQCKECRRERQRRYYATTVQKTTDNLIALMEVTKRETWPAKLYDMIKLGEMNKADFQQIMRWISEQP